MKHLKQLFVLALLTLLSVSVWGETAEFSYSDLQGQGTSGSGSAFTGATDGDITMGGYGNGNTSYTQIYANGTLTFTPSNGATITEIVLTATNASYAKTWSATPGSVSVSSATITWTGTSTSVVTLTNTATAQARITGMVVTYTAGGSSDVIVKTLKSIAVAGMTTSYDQGDVFSFDGTCTATYSVTKNDVPQADEEKVVTPTSVTSPDMSTTGEKEITVTYTENEVTKTTSYNITVNTHVVTPGEYGVLLDNVLWGVTSGQQAAGVTSLSGRANDINFAMTKGGSQMYASATQTRFYNGATLTISAPTGFVITSIVFAEPTTDKRWDGSITADEDTYDEDLKTWAGSAQSVQFSFGAQNRIATATVTYEAYVAPTVAVPTFSLATGTYLGTQSVEITCATAGADIYYTLDNTDPSDASTPYTGAISITETKTLKAIAIKGSDESAIASATYTIETLDHAGTQVDPYSVADAKKVIDVLGTMENAYVSGIVSNIVTTTLPAEGYITFYISADGATSGQQLEAYKCKSLNGDAFSALSDVETGATVVITGTLKKYNSTYEFDQNCHLVSYEAPTVPKTSIANDQANPYTVAQAIAYAADGVTYDLDDYVYVSGVVYDVKNFNTTNGTLDIYIKDDGESNQFELYKCAGINDGSSTTPFEALTDVQVGDEVIAYGQLTLYNTTYEFKQGNYLVSLSRKLDPEISWDPESAELTWNDALTQADYPEPGLIIQADLGGDPLDFITFSSDNESLATINANGQITWDVTKTGTVHFTATFPGNATYKPVTAVCTVTIKPEPTPLSPWATVYTSNITLSTEGGTSASAAKVKFYGEEGDGYDAIKAGTGSVEGAVVVNVPAGATALHFHAYSWNTETVELTVTAPTGVTVTPSTAIAINKNSGIANSSPFTLAEGSTPQTDAYYAVALSGNAAATDITISATSGKRFVLFGVNQEGGVLPVLESIEISGDLTNKTGYKAGDALDLDGLTVEATYSLGGVNQTPVDITNDPDLALTYDPLAENQTEVTITASYKGQTDDITITGLDPVASADPLIYVSKLNVNFASVEVGDAVPAAQTITVTLTNVASVTATLGGTNADAFSISPTSLTASGDITISILANTDVAASYSATLTISDGEGGADDKMVNLSFAVTEPVAEDDVAGTWTLVTDAATLAAGKKVIVAQYVDADGAINTMAAQKSNNRGVVESAVAGTTLTPATGTKVMTLVDAGTGKFYLQTSDGKYLYNASTSGNSYLRTKDEETDASWTISVTAAGVATITSVENTNRTIMRYNENGTNPALFNCYASGQNDIALYMLEETTPPAKDVIRDGLSDGKWGTICPKKTVENVEGAVFYQITYLEEKDGMPYNIVLDEIGTTTLTAGKPYVFIASGTQILGNKTGDAVTAGQDHNGLYGYISATDESMALSYSTDFNASGDNTYVVYENSFYRINGATNLKSERCYININSTEPSRSYVAPNPVRRRITVNVSETNATTGFGEINSSDVPVKMIIDGKMYILRGEKLFDATGRLVK